MDLHGEFAAWIADGARGDPARDVAVHASGCEACMRQAAAVDSLLNLDLDATPLPAMPTARPHRASRSVLITRAIAGVAVIVLVVSAGAIAAGGLFAPPRAGAPPGPSTSAPAPAEGVLGGVPSSEDGSTTQATDSASPEASHDPSFEASPTATIVETRRPATIGLPQPTISLVSATPTPRPATPRPVSPPPSPIVIPATASPSPAPTASPLPSVPPPTPSPEPTCDPIDAGCTPSPGP